METLRVLADAQQILHDVFGYPAFRGRQREVVEHVAQVERFQHQRLSTFGIGQALSQAQWSSVFRQLVAGGLLTVDMEAYGGLRLTEAARPLLRGEQEIWLRRDAEPVKQRKTRIERITRPGGASDDPL